MRQKVEFFEVLLKSSPHAENDLHSTVSTHKQLIASRNKTTFEKRIQVSEFLNSRGVEGSAQLATSTDAGEKPFNSFVLIKLN